MSLTQPLFFRDMRPAVKLEWMLKNILEIIKKTLKRRDKKDTIIAYLGLKCPRTGLENLT